jgi:hypothetical protein
MNTYDRTTMREPHRRAVARAGALAAAFGCNLALFGFPMPKGVRTPEELADWSATKTTIGQGALYFAEIARAGRVALFEAPKGGFPPQLGTAVCTTSQPRLGKAVPADALRRRIEEGESVLLVFGLGPHGLPDAVRRLCAADFDVTGGGYSLETATAMGAVTAALAPAGRTRRPPPPRPLP